MIGFRPLRPTRFALPLGLYLVSAVWGLWAGNWQLGDWPLLGFTLASLPLYALLVNLPEPVPLRGQRQLFPLRFFFGSLPAALSVWFLLTNDWDLSIGKLAWLDPALSWFSTWTLRSRYSLDPNSAGGLLAAFLPLQLAALTAPRVTGGWRGAGLMGVCLTVLGLFLSVSRGAWLALVVVGAVWGGRHLVAALATRLASDRRRWWGPALRLFGLAVVGFCALLLIGSPWGAALTELVAADRAVIWRNSLDLATDYIFTGVGLGRFEMAYSSYVMLLHVGHTFHAHNLFLNLWLEQGLPGLLALGWMLAVAAKSCRSVTSWGEAALASLGVMLVHGLVDDAFIGYGGRVLVMVLPLAVLDRPGSIAALSAMVRPAVRQSRAGLIGAGVLAALAVSLIFIPKVKAAFLSNLGALSQSRLELAAYRWPAWSVQDELRRALGKDLEPARQYYGAALVLDPGNATANRRLGQIELGLGEYEAACGHVEAAYRTAPDQRATRQLLGECYAIFGDPYRAAEVWRTIDVSQSQLALRWWWYEYLGDRERLAWFEEARELVR